MAGNGVVLGYLKYVLGMDSLAFEQGAGEAEKRLKATERHFQQVGDRMQGIGTKLSAGITAPVLAIGAAFVSSARGMAETVPQLEQAARLANTSTTEFQKLAFAAKSVGVESDSLASIYKDVNDKVGEFISTGGGEMKDFFENIAPKVGLTAEAFRKLSGPQALQAYVTGLQKAGLTQAEMTFYMESLADDATVLLPLLMNNGKAMDEIGKKAAIISPKDIEQFKRYNDAQTQMDQSLKKLTITLVSSGLLEAVTNLVSSAAEFAGAVSKVSPETVKWGIGLTSVAAAIGPVVFGVGSLVKTFAPLLARLTPVIGTAGAAATGAGGVGLVGMATALAPIAIAAAAVVVAYKNWDKIGPWIDNVSKRMTDWSVKADADIKVWTDGAAAIDKRMGIPSKDEFLTSITRTLRESVARTDEWIKWIMGYVDAFDAGFMRIATSVPGHMQRMYEGIKTWMGDKLGAIWTGAAAKIQWIADKFKWLDDVVVRHSYIPDMVDSIGDHMRRLDAEMVKPATGAANKTAEEFRKLAASLSPILARLYPEEARQNKLAADIAAVTAAAKAGIIPANEAADAIKRLNDEYSRELGGKPTAKDVVGEPNDDDLGLPDPADVEVKIGDIREQLGGLENANDNAAASFEDMANRALGALDGLIGAIKGGDFVDILSSIADAFFSLGGASLFGKPNANTIDFGGFRAAGGPVTSGRTYMVGERGPEMFTATRSGYINPNPGNDNGYGQTVRVVVDEGPMFRTTIQQEAMTSATAVSLDQQRTATKRQRATMGTGRR